MTRTNSAPPGGAAVIHILEDNREATEVRVVVPGDQSGRLDQILCQRLVRYSRERIQGIIRSGCLSVNGRVVVKPGARLRGGETILFLRPLPEGEEPLPPVGILEQSHDLLITSKPGDLTVHPSANALKRTLTAWLTLESLDHFTPAHRLDRETSGIVVCARRGAVSREVQMLFQDQLVKKGYVALLRGVLPRELTVEQPLGNDCGPIYIKQGVCEEGAPSKTRFIPIAHNEVSTLVMVLPATGRQHQIRVHADFAGVPIWGDKIYGVEPEVFLTFIEQGLTAGLLARLKFSRHMLHAAYIRVPLSSGSRIFYAHPPEDFLEAAGQLGIVVPPPPDLMQRFDDCIA
ncbi:hypothetical protein KJ865_15575 [Myxococcota bacterium]|nr:hypothetical protein [Myxococcota bacterium]